MSVLSEILIWSQDRPEWQRDALRRLIQNNEISDSDISDLTEICKGTYGLSEQQEVIPLSKEHVPDETINAPPVALDSIFHYRGVNALAENQILKFANSLTIIYGDNAAGKSGYIRILKSACRARGQEQILGNVVSEATPYSPTVSIKYRVGTESELREWDGSDEAEPISRVSVFDSQCASVYLTQKTDVAFRPFGLDLFDMLVKVCKAVRLNLEGEQSALAPRDLTAIQAQIPEGTSAAKLLSNINILTKPETIHELTRLSPEEKSQHELLEKSLLDLQVNDPKKLIQQLTLLTGRIEALNQHIKAEIVNAAETPLIRI